MSFRLEGKQAIAKKTFLQKSRVDLDQIEVRRSNSLSERNLVGNRVQGSASRGTDFKVFHLVVDRQVFGYVGEECGDATKVADSRSGRQNLQTSLVVRGPMSRVIRHILRR